MKKILVSVALVVLISVPCSQARPNPAFLGALLGGGAGFVWAHNDDGVDEAWAVPALALAGAVLGNQLDKRMRSQEEAQAPTHGAEAVSPRVREDVRVANDPHPGVDLIKVSILNSNGARSDVNIIRAGDRFVGPQGEVYSALPTAEDLYSRYGM